MVVDVAIVGAGPGGCAAALELGKCGLRVALVDKSIFPRDKVCGDAIPGPAIKVLHEIDPRYALSLNELPTVQRSRRTRLHLNGHRPVTLHWETVAYTCRRTDFDHHLLGLVRRYTPTHVRTGSAVEDIDVREDGVVLQMGNGETIRAGGVIGADGAQSLVGKLLAGHRLDREHHGGAVRQYYRGVAGLEADRLEIHSLPDFMPGYFWIFPLADGGCNVGFGMHSAAITAGRVNLRASIGAFIDASPELRERFRGAAPTEAVVGFGLPFGSRRIRVSGNRYLLVGDAASLIDPLTGDGIGQAIGSGLLAARAAATCHAGGNWSDAATAGYGEALHRRYGKMLRTRTRVLDAHRRWPFLVDWGARLLAIGPVRRMVRPYL